jgi:hypothetical protein
MSKKVTSYLCAVYGGVIKVGYIRYVHTDNVPEDELEKFKDVYGSEIKARYVKVAFTAAEAYQKLKERLSKEENVHVHGDIYEMNISKAVKLMKEATGTKKASTWNLPEGDNEEKEAEDTNNTNNNHEEEKHEAKTETKTEVKTEKKANTKVAETKPVETPTPAKEEKKAEITKVVPGKKAPAAKVASASK